MLHLDFASYVLFWCHFQHWIWFLKNDLTHDFTANFFFFFLQLYQQQKINFFMAPIFIFLYYHPFQLIVEIPSIEIPSIVEIPRIIFQNKWLKSQNSENHFRM